MLGKTRRLGGRSDFGAYVIVREGIFEETIELETLKKPGRNMETWRHSLNLGH